MNSGDKNLMIAEKQAIFDKIVIRYPPHLKFYDRCDYLRQLGQTTRGRPQKGMRALGPSGSGKSHAADTYKEYVEGLAEQSDDIVPVIIVPLGSATTSKRLMSSILHKFGDDHAANGSEYVLTRRAQACFKHFQTQLLIIDEVQHLNFRTSEKNDVTDSLKGFLDSGVVPIVFLGTDEASDMFKRNLQLNGRLISPSDFDPLRQSEPGDRQLLAGYVRQLNSAIVESGLLPTESDLTDPWVLGCLHEVSAGIIGRISRLFHSALEIALRRQASRLEIYDLALAVDRWAIPQSFVETNPFERRRS